MIKRKRLGPPARMFFAWRFIALPLAAMLLSGSLALAQDDAPPLPEDPRPLDQLITPQERELVGKSRNPKKLVEVYLDISDAHLDLAYAATKAGDIRTAERELDVFNKAIAKAAEVAFSQQDGKRGLSKKIEQKLYKQLRTLDNMLRLFPVERVAFTEAAIKHAKTVRVNALNETFASGEILADPSKLNKPEKQAPQSDNREPFSPGMTKQFVAAGARAARQLPGDYLTEEEDEIVRQAQKADDRIKVFMKIADRRLAALTGTGADSQINSEDKKTKERADKELRNWGALAKLSRVQLLQHYSKAIDEAIAKLEDAHERNPKSSALPKALEVLRDATDKHIAILRSLEAELKTEGEQLAAKTAIDRAEQANQGAKETLKRMQPEGK